MSNNLVEDVFDKGRSQEPWSQSQAPHTLSTKLSRFLTNAGLPDPATYPLANAVFQARCEIVQDDICLPSTMALSADGSCLVVVSGGGFWKRNPLLEYWSIHGDTKVRQETIEVPLSSTTYSTLALDDTRKLMFVADRGRVKSFSWERGEGTPMHTLNSGQHTGQLLLLPNGRILRAGEGSALLWNIDCLETHGPSMKTIGEGEFDFNDSWREPGDAHNLESSTGSMPDAMVRFFSESFKPEKLHLHQPSCHVLSGGGQNYSCLSLDLEHGGAVVSTFTGHGGYVKGFSTSEGDPNLFATACSDGHARLYDVRMPHPTLTFDVEGPLWTVGDVVYTHIDGLPVMFTGGEGSQGIKLWDIRNKQCVYELSTGNTEVSTLIWNSKCATLYASTECPYLDRRGIWNGYRTVRDPALRKDRRSSEWRGGRYRGPGFDEYGRYWPKEARHDESSFGYIYDAGDHSLFEYAFKENARVDVLPRYGDAQPERSIYRLLPRLGAIINRPRRFESLF